MVDFLADTMVQAVLVEEDNDDVVGDAGAQVTLEAIRDDSLSEVAAVGKLP